MTSREGGRKKRSKADHKKERRAKMGEEEAREKKQRRKTPSWIRQCKCSLGSRLERVPLVCLTAYTTPMARWVDAVADVILVGDSLGMVLYGFESTLPVTVEMMCAHGAAVVRASQSACVVVDMPFGSYQESPEQALRTAVRLLQETGCSAVKVEGGRALAATIAFLVERGIPVMGHVGLVPQSVRSLGGFSARGGTVEEANAIREDALSVCEAGAFALVIEHVAESLARDVTEALPIPVIGIGASPHCDGQILVSEDLLELFSEFTPKFVRRYARLAPQIQDALASYAADVRFRRFPSAAECSGGEAAVRGKKPPYSEEKSR